MTVRSLAAAPLSVTALAAAALCACSSGGGTVPNADTGVARPADAAEPADTGMTGTPDTGLLPQADSGLPPDAGRADAGRSDGSIPDSGVDAPLILSFTANPMMARAGQTVQLIWAVRNADRVSIAADPGGDVPIPAPMGTCNPATTCAGMVTSPAITAPVAFVLTAYKGTATAMRPVGVLFDPGPPVITRFIPDPPSVRRGMTSTLRWMTTNATRVRITQGATLLYSSNINDPGQMVTSGAYVTPPLNDPSGLNPFTLEAYNEFPNGMTSQHVIISAN